ncbi:hypothetical protein OESDEN_02623 [Oesophagostomum dentatum]|uniref:Uncharacterized protein n=1 Tax=Oesophagostomum dentatum TaxID=61180 RepID=A0A0B1TJF4_OESDE|nr:hypothetical protein OESDEN_02623 [Oesophagostomum dentatum]
MVALQRKKNLETFQRRGSAEEPANTGGKDPPKRVFPKRRRLRLNPDDSDSVKTEDTIYERRTKDRMESASASVRSLLRRRHEGLKVDRTQSLQRTLSQSAEDMAKSSSKEGVDQSESKAKNLLESVREWLNEQCTQRQMDSSEGNEPANSPKRRKSKRKKVSTLLPYQGIPVEHALPSDRLAREARSSTSLPKMESAELASRKEHG